MRKYFLEVPRMAATASSGLRPAYRQECRYAGRIAWQDCPPHENLRGTRRNETCVRTWLFRNASRAQRLSTTAGMSEALCQRIRGTGREACPTAIGGG